MSNKRFIQRKSSTCKISSYFASLGHYKIITIFWLDRMTCYITLSFKNRTSIFRNDVHEIQLFIDIASLLRHTIPCNKLAITAFDFQNFVALYAAYHSQTNRAFNLLRSRKYMSDVHVLSAAISYFRRCRHARLISFIVEHFTNTNLDARKATCTRHGSR